jgi:hypothetical protein
LLYSDALVESNHIALFGKNAALSSTFSTSSFTSFSTSFSTFSSTSTGTIPSNSDLESDSLKLENEEREKLKEIDAENNQKNNEKSAADVILEKEKDIFDQIEVSQL